VSFTDFSYRNHAYTEVWRDTADTLDPYHVTENPTGTTQQVGSAGGSVMNDVTASRGTDYYYWIRFVSQANITGPWNAGTGGGTLAALADLLVAEFASNIVPVQLVDTLPTVGMVEGDFAYLTTDKKLYRYDGTDWINAVDGADVSTGTLPADAIVVNSITAGQIAAGAINADELAVNAIQVGTAVIEDGAIINAMIGDLAVDSAKIAEGAITNLKFDRATVNKIEILTADIKLANITTALIKDAAINTAKIGLAQITTALIGTAQVDTLAVAGDAITAGGSATRASKLITNYNGYPTLPYPWVTAASFTINAGTTGIQIGRWFMSLRVIVGMGVNGGTWNMQEGNLEIRMLIGTQASNSVFTVGKLADHLSLNFEEILDIIWSGANTQTGSLTAALQMRVSAFTQSSGPEFSMYMDTDSTAYVIGTKR
jgi:hypothetical protein